MMYIARRVCSLEASAKRGFLDRDLTRKYLNTVLSAGDSVTVDNANEQWICSSGIALRFFLSEEIPSHHHDVVLFGLYANYIQYEDHRVIDSNYTCDLKVQFLQDANETHLANLYQGQCNTLYKGQILVSL